MSYHWQALGWTLINFLWQGMVIALVYRAADLVFARRSANVRYVLALIALFSTFAIALATFIYETASFHSAVFSAGNSDGAIWNHVPVVSVLAAAPSAVSVHLSARFLAYGCLPFLDVLWFVGILIFTVRALGGWWLLRRLRLSTIQSAPDALLFRLNAMRLEMGIRRFVDLHLSNRIGNPLSAGALRPWILLPISALTGLSPEQIEIVLFHELAHIRRYDYLWNIFQTIIETLLFFHPAVWWISRRVREERELCCDDAVLAHRPDPAAYASALLRLEEERCNFRLAMALNGDASRSGLRARIVHILGVPGSSRGSVRSLSLAVIAVVVAIFLCPMPHLFASFRVVPEGVASISHAAGTVATNAAPDSAVLPHRVPALAQSAATSKADGASQTKPSAAQPAVAAKPIRDLNHTDYIDEMRTAGYDVSINQMIGMKMQDITPEYAEAMAKAGFGKPTADQLIGLKIQGVTPEYAQELHASGIHVFSFNDLISGAIFHVTPKFARSVKTQFPGVTLNDLIQMRIFHIDSAFIVSAQRHGFAPLTIQKLVRLRISGVLN